MNTFKCPECGSIEVGSHLYLQIGGNWTVKRLVICSQQIHCANCDEYIPSISEKMDNISYKQAKEEWLTKYKYAK